MKKLFYIIKITHISSGLNIVASFTGTEEDLELYWGKNKASKAFYSRRNKRSKLQKDSIPIEDDTSLYSKSTLYVGEGDMPANHKRMIISKFIPRQRSKRVYHQKHQKKY